MLMEGCSKDPLDESILIEKERLMYESNSDEPYSGEVFTNYYSGEKEYRGRYENGLLIEYSYINKDGSVKEPVNMETLIDSSGLLYGVSRQKPYTGDVFELNKNGGKKYFGSIKGGRQDKLWTYLHPNGQKEKEGTFKDGIKDGKWTFWHSNGQKEKEGTFIDGKEDGKWTYLHSNGEKKKVGNYKNGKSDGKWTYWYDNGREIISFMPELVTIKGGTFRMGSNRGDFHEKPAHTVTVSDFNISKTEVTFEQYDSFCDATGRKRPDDEGSRRDRPVNVTWHDAVAFCDWMSQQTGKKIRLPTEAEWEYAARGGNKSQGYTYSGSSNLDAVGWYYDNSSYEPPRRVGEKQPNELGLYDMSGNVWEWCADWYDKNYYSRSPQADPKGPDSGTYRILRGGGRYSLDDICRSANRWYSLDSRNQNVGFRCAQNTK